MRTTTKRTLAIGAGLAITVGSAIGASAATTGNSPQTDQKVYFCYNDKDSSKNYILTHRPLRSCMPGYSKVVALSDQYRIPEGSKGETGAKGAPGPQGPEGPKGRSGVSNLIAGAGYTTEWTGDKGATLQTAREECPAGQYALGGGFSTFGGDKDLGGDNKDIQVTVSAPYFEGDYKPVDEAGNFRPTEWVVKGFNNGTTAQVVRAWVTCADIPAN
jgi:hypothetical protein